ncbi:Rtn1p Ecym_5124 [Eremothecium cymbalariae DBVPG|uniref:Reticulon-like protein n=1 Tax=Eremothecium cymbalariae (strain CBS 270.75 / DBVPG 7215 / KCTC 17166 / NRRL Y-17582) TaxID=931890 RepID=I6NCW1_ERECY|nr:hypothetical protein Ecym_5124 [Eremothecium cymbalariae DBVPG\
MASCDLLLWKNPVQTGKVFGGLLFLLLVLKKVNLITFFLKVGYSILFVNSTVEFVSKLVLGQGLTTKYGVKECPNIVGMLRPKIEEFLVQFPVYQAHVRRLVFAASPRQSFKAAGVLYVLHKLVSVLSLWTLVFIGVIATFTLPIVYKTYQKEIDGTVQQGVVLAKQKSIELQKIASEKAAPYMEQLDKRLGPVSQYLVPKGAAALGGSKSGSNASGPGPAATAPVSAGAGAVEEPSMATTTSASFPSVPATDVSASVTKDVDVNVAQLKQDVRETKESVGL